MPGRVNAVNINGGNLMNVKRARERARTYCKENGLSVEKLNEKPVCYSPDELAFLDFPDIEADGLRNDMETLGFPVLIVNKNYEVLETEKTRQYLL